MNIQHRCLAFLLLGASLCAQDSATTLARILANKGQLSRQELLAVESAPAIQRVDMLTALLARKGVLDASEVQTVQRANSMGTPPDPVFVNAGYAQPATTASSAAPATADTPPRNAATVPPVTSQTKVPVQIYGTLLLNSFFDTSANNIQDVPLFNNKQGADALGNDKSFGITARQSRFGLKFQGPSLLGAETSGQAEIDFFGGKAALGNGINMDLPRLRLAFARLDWSNAAFEAGQDWSVFAPLNPTSLASYGIPAMSASGNPWIRTPQVRGEFHNAKDSQVKVLLQVAATDPNMGDYQTTAFQTTRTPGIGERGRLPGADARLAISGGEDSHKFTIGLSSHYARGKNAGALGALTIQAPVDSWGTALDWTLPITSRFNISGEAYLGRALGIFSVASGESIGAVGTSGQHGVFSRGGWIQAQFDMTKKWQLNLSYGQDAQRANEVPVGNRDKNQTYLGNVMYKVSANLTFALEWRRFLTDFRNQRSANERGDQANLGIAYIF